MANPFVPGGGNMSLGAGQQGRQGGADCPTGPILGPGSELRRLYSMPHTMGHASAVQCLAMVDGKVYSGGRDNQLFMWRGDKQPGQEFQLVQDGAPIACSSSVNSILYDAPSKWLFLGLWRGDIQAYCKEPVMDCRLEGHRRCVSSLVFHTNVLVSGSHDATVRLWTPNPQVGRFEPCGQPLTNPSGPVNAVRVLNGSLWVGAEEGITCFDLTTLQAKGTIPSPVGVSKMLELDGYMLAAYKNGEVRIFDGNGGQIHLHPSRGEHTSNTAIEMMMHPFERKPMLLCGQDFGYTTVYDLPDFRPRGTFVSKNQSHVTSIVDIKADGMFLTSGFHGDIMMWQWQQGGGKGMGMGGGNSNVPVAANPFAGTGNVPVASNPFAPSGMGGMGGTDLMM
mmetsp:Transcript_9432/g.15256  ORF Transcript_9432/g.15256 Transcript_9432/m.15256 type:complete len:393 (+) Transcript_9432:128-1306(+)